MFNQLHTKTHSLETLLGIEIFYYFAFGGYSQFAIISTKSE